MNRSERGESILQELRETHVPMNMVAIWYLGQSSIILKGNDEKLIAIDPYFSPSPHRTYPPPFNPESLTDLSMVCITHEHIDHLDPYAIRAIAASNKDTVFIAPACCHALLTDCGVKKEKIKFANTDGLIDNVGIIMRPIPAAHETFEYDEESRHRFVGYILNISGINIYHAGDTVIYPGLVDVLKEESIDIAFLPINGRDFFRNEKNILGNMDIREAAELTAKAGIDTVIPIHYDMYAGNGEYPGRFIDYLYQFYPFQKSHILARFERYMFVSQKLMTYDFLTF